MGEQYAPEYAAQDKPFSVFEGVNMLRIRNTHYKKITLGGLISAGMLFYHSKKSDINNRIFGVSVLRYINLIDNVLSKLFY